MDIQTKKTFFEIFNTKGGKTNLVDLSVTNPYVIEAKANQIVSDQYHASEEGQQTASSNLASHE